MNQGKKRGAFFTIIAGALALAACVVYIGVMYKLPIVFILLIAAAAVSAAAFVGKAKVVTTLAPAVIAFLSATSVIWAVNPMVNQLGYVVSGLDDISTVIALIISGALMVASMVVAIVSSFMPQNETEA
ncbi:MAG: hypothetical protein J5959_12100 [Butyrivibrio sp.]|nr:hypothetical protein [Butyrivibrio sp.]